MIAAHAPKSVVPIQPHPARLQVVAAVVNPNRYLKRYELYRTFEKMVADAGADLWTVECAFGTRPFEITSASNPHHIQMRTTDELWLKENLWNIGNSRIPESFEYIANVDADFSFARSDWAQETIQQLQHFDVVQMFSKVSYLDSNHEIHMTANSFMYSWMNGASLKTWNGPRNGGAYYGAKMAGGYPTESFGAPGGAFAYRRSSLSALGGLQDYHILGSGDTYMIGGLLGISGDLVHPKFSPGYKAKIALWEKQAVRSIRKNVGCVDGTALHYWHGTMANRNYGGRNGILIQTQFDPNTDILHSAQGVVTLHDDNTPRFIKLRDDLRSYFRVRNEDALS